MPGRTDKGCTRCGGTGWVNLAGEKKTRCPGEPQHTTGTGTPSGFVSTLAEPKRHANGEIDMMAEKLAEHTRTGVSKNAPSLTVGSPVYAQFKETYLTREIPASEEKAENIARLVHAGQTDQLGAPYIHHPESVVTLTTQLPEYARLTEQEQENARQAAWLHDALEDTVLTEQDLRDAGFNEEVISVIESVTARKNEPREAYYERVKAGGPVAIVVKLGDLGHNNLPARRENLPGSPSNPVQEGEEDKYTRLGRKYHKAYTALGTVPEHLLPFAPE